MLVVEPVRNTDVDPVARLAIDSLQERYAPEWLAEHANVKNGTFLVARDVPTNTVVGFALAEKGEAEGHLLALAVDRDRRGQGIGRALLADVRERFLRLATVAVAEEDEEELAADPRNRNLPAFALAALSH